MCCTKATNENLIRKYHQEKARKKDKNRKCDVCASLLSIYNKDSKCHACQIKETEEERINFLKDLGFGYENEE